MGELVLPLGELVATCPETLGSLSFIALKRPPWRKLAADGFLQGLALPTPASATRRKIDTKQDWRHALGARLHSFTSLEVPRNVEQPAMCVKVKPKATKNQLSQHVSPQT